MHARTRYVVLGILTASLTGRASAQLAGRGLVVVPQERVYSDGAGGSPALGIERVAVLVTITDQLATTSMRVELHNRAGVALEAELVVPVPDGAVVKGFDFEGAAEQPTARLLERGEARSLYQSIVSRSRDPALLEFAGTGAVRSSVFPVPASGRQHVVIAWDQVLPATGDRVDYLLPRSEAFAPSAIPWEIGLRLSSQSSLATIWSPSHELVETRLEPGLAFVQVPPGARPQPGPFLLSFLRRSAGVATSVLACPAADAEGGYLLLLGGVPDVALDASLRREVTLVIDRSGSMRGEKFTQALEAARQVVEGLKEGEAFQIIDYSTDVAAFSEQPVIKDASTIGHARSYLDRLAAGGGTNLHDALMRALSQPPAEGRLPVVLFLTDGLPTVGVRDEARIRDAARDGNAARRRVFTFGVGTDVNAPLLDALASESRAHSSYVLPGEDVEVKVGEVYQRLFGPVLADAVLSVHADDGAPDPRRLTQVLPARLADLYAGDPLRVSARWHGESPVRLRISGTSPQGPAVIEARFDPAAASRDHGFVARLWADRRIGELVDEVRLAGAAPGAAPSDPRLDELVQEVVALSTEFGILSEYTAFMATEGADVWNPHTLNQRVRTLLAQRAGGVRTGRGAVSQAVNLSRMRSGRQRGRLNAFLDENLAMIEISSLRHVDDLAFFHVGGRWVDSRILALIQTEHAAREASAPPVPSVLHEPMETADFGTEAWEQVVRRLEAEHHAGVLGLPGTIYLLVDGRRVLIRPAAPAAPTPPAPPKESSP